MSDPTHVTTTSGSDYHQLHVSYNASLEYLKYQLGGQRGDCSHTTCWSHVWRNILSGRFISCRIMDWGQMGGWVGGCPVFAAIRIKSETNCRRISAKAHRSVSSSQQLRIKCIAGDRITFQIMASSSSSSNPSGSSGVKRLGGKSFMCDKHPLCQITRKL